MHYSARRRGTCVEQTRNRRKFHRSFTGADFLRSLKSEAPDPAATGSSACNAYLTSGRPGVTMAAHPRIAGTLRLRLGDAA